MPPLVNAPDVSAVEVFYFEGIDRKRDGCLVDAVCGTVAVAHSNVSRDVTAVRTLFPSRVQPQFQGIKCPT